MQATRVQRSSRVIRVLCITDHNIFDIVDGGVTKSGEATQSRLHAERTLKKRVLVLGSETESLPVFALAEIPQVFSVDDPFDRDHLKDRDGGWATPTPKWLAEQDRRVVRRKDSARIAESKAKQTAANAVVDNLARLVAPAAEPEKRIDSDKKGGKP